MLFRQDTDPSNQEFFTICSELIITAYKSEKIYTNYVIKSNTLKKLTIFNLNITKLDVSECTSLQTLTCTNNNIKQLIINNNLITLNCARNRITEFIPTRNLINLNCSYNKLSTLKLSNNLIEVHCQSNELNTFQLNKKLLILDCNNNKIKKLNLNRKLKILHCKRNLLIKLELNFDLHELHCAFNQLETIKINSFLTKLSCKYNKITSLTLRNFFPIKKILLKTDCGIIIIQQTPLAFNKFIPTSDEETICTICLEATEDLIITDCGHTFHMTCIMAIRNNKCPCCRQIIVPLKHRQYRLD